jgi:Raf kinase inhibitor-like YbhB/YbcL family protein
MKRYFVLLIVLLLLLAFVSCGTKQKEESTVNELTVTSTAFSEGGSIPLKYSGYGENLSPPLKIAGISPAVKSLAIIMDDPDAPSGTFTHWLIWNIPTANADIPENVAKTDSVAALSGAAQGRNDTGANGYFGPRPPSGTHRYLFKVYGLDAMLPSLQPGASRSALENAMAGHILQTGVLKGTYSK